MENLGNTLFSELFTDETTQSPPGQHSHSLTLQVDEIETLLKGGKVTTASSEDLRHSHKYSFHYLNWNLKVAVLYQFENCLKSIMSKFWQLAMSLDLINRIGLRINDQ